MKNLAKRAAILLALVALSLSCSVIPFLSPTPTPTLTPSPTPSPTLTPTSVPNAIIEELDGGSKRFTDYQDGYSLTLPRDWLVLYTVDLDIEQVIEDAITEYPDFVDDLEALAALSRESSYRLLALDTDPDHAALSTPKMNLHFQDQIESGNNLPLERALQIAAERLPQSYAGLEVKKTELVNNLNGVQLGTIYSVWTTRSPDGEELPVALIQNLFATSEGLATITFSLPLEMLGILGPDYDAIINSIEVLVIV